MTLPTTSDRRRDHLPVPVGPAPAAASVLQHVGALQAACAELAGAATRDGEALRTAAHSAATNRRREAAARAEAVAADTCDHLDALVADLGPATAPWTAPLWRQLPDRQPAPPPLLRIGDLQLDSGVRTLTAPALIAPGGILLTAPATPDGADPATERSAAGWLAGLALRLAAATRLGKVEVHLADTLLSGVPFAPLTGGRAGGRAGLVPAPIATTADELAALLATMRATADRVVSTRLHDQPDLAAFNAAGRGRGEPWRVLLVHARADHLTPAAAANLTRLFADGPRAGVLPMVALATSTDQRPGRQPSPVTPAPTTTTIAIDGSGLRWSQQPVSGLFHPDAPTAALITDVVAALSAVYEEEATPKVALTDLWTDPVWSHRTWTTVDSNTGAVSTVVGLADDGSPLEFVLDEGEQAHGFVVGPNGSGKSTFLHALITGLGRKYSPDELELYLMDFKQGVEFGRYAPGDVTASGLPQARVLALQADQAYAASVLRYLTDRIRERGRLLTRKSAEWRTGVRSRAAYLAEAARRGADVEPMPAVVCIVDEFQALFPDQSGLSREVVGMVDNIVRQGRFVGVHLLLCSQNLNTGAGGGMSLAGATVNEIAVRVCYGMKAEDAVRVLEPGNDAPARLPKYHAVFNNARGAVAANRVAAAGLLPDPDPVLPVIHAAALAAGITPQTAVFSADEAQPLPAVPGLADALATPATTTPTQLPLHLAATATLADAAPVVPLRDTLYQHVLVAGGDPQTSAGATVAAVLSAAAADPTLRLCLLDPDPGPEVTDPLRRHVLAAVGARGMRIPAGEVAQALRDLAGLVDARRTGTDTDRDRIVLTGWSLDELRPWLVDQKTLQALTRIEDAGPAVGVHLMLGFASVSAATQVINLKRAVSYGVKLLLPVDSIDGAVRLAAAADDAPPEARGTLLWRTSQAQRRLVLPPQALLAYPDGADPDELAAENAFLAGLTGRLIGDGRKLTLPYQHPAQPQPSNEVAPATTAVAPATSDLDVDVDAILASIPDVDL